MTARDRLGKGLGALLGEYLEPEAKPGDIQRIPLKAIVPNPLQPRRVFSEQELSDLASSIAANGLLQPLVVRPAPGTQDRFELIAGERRYRALGLLGWEDAPVLVRSATNETLLVLALVENLQREALNPLEEAEGYVALAEQFDMNQGEIAAAVGKDRSTVANLVRLLKLPTSVRRLLADGELSTGHARALLAVEDSVRAGELARQAVKEGWSVREVERRVKQERKPKRESPRRVDPILESLEHAVRDHLGTRVSIRPSRGGGGVITVSYHDDTDFERVFELITGRSVREALE
jgi:ParB family chromosome partitioning protein